MMRSHPLQDFDRIAGRDAREQGSLVLRAHPALLDPGLRHLDAVVAAGFGFLQGHVLQHGGHAAAGLHVGDAAAHHAGAQDAHFLRLVARHVLGPGLPRLDRVHVEEERVDHVLRDRADDQLGEIARLDAQGGIEIDLRAFHHGRQRVFGCRVQAAGLLLEHGGGHAQHAGDLGIAGRAAGHLVVLVVPGLLRLRMRFDPGQGRRAQGRGAGHQFMHQAELQRLARREQLALQDVGLRAHQAEQAGHLGDARGAGDEAQRDLGQAELDLGVVHGDAVVADQRDLPAAAQRRAVEAADDRLAQGFERAEVLLRLLDFAEHLRRVGRLQPHRALEVGAGEEGALVRRQHDALDGILVADDLGGDLGQVVLPLRAHGVDGRSLLVEGDRGDAVLQFVLDGFHEVVIAGSTRNPCSSGMAVRWMIPDQVRDDRLRGAPRWSRYPCRRPRTAWPGHTAACGDAIRRSGC